MARYQPSRMIVDESTHEGLQNHRISGSNCPGHLRAEWTLRQDFQGQMKALRWMDLLKPLALSCSLERLECCLPLG